MFWSLKTVLAISLVGLTTAQKPSPLCGTNPDATTFFRNMVTHTYPKALADYNAVIAAFPNSNATPEDIDDLYHAGEAYYRQYLDTFTTALSYVEVEIWRNCTTAPTALATVFNSTSRVQELLPQLERVMKGISSFEPQILAQGRPGHWAIYQPLDYLAYTSWYTATKLIRQDIASGKPSAFEDVAIDYYNTVEAVRKQYYREGYGQQPRD